MWLWLLWSRGPHTAQSVLSWSPGHLGALEIAEGQQDVGQSTRGLAQSPEGGGQQGGETKQSGCSRGAPITSHGGAHPSPTPRCCFPGNLPRKAQSHPRSSCPALAGPCQPPPGAPQVSEPRPGLTLRGLVSPNVYVLPHLFCSPSF